MYARCPSCNTTFAITAKQLEVRDGLVRCGRCFDVFNARWNLLDKKADDGTTRPADKPAPKANQRPQPRTPRGASRDAPGRPASRIISATPAPSVEARASAASVNTKPPVTARVTSAPKPKPKPKPPSAGEQRQTQQARPRPGETTASATPARTPGTQKPVAQKTTPPVHAQQAKDPTGVVPRAASTDPVVVTGSTPASPTGAIVAMRDADDRSATSEDSGAQYEPKVARNLAQGIKSAQIRPGKRMSDLDAATVPVGANTPIPPPPSGRRASRFGFKKRAKPVDLDQFDGLILEDVAQASTTRVPRWTWVACAFAGVLLMAVQMRAFYLDELAQSPQWRSTAKLLCQVTLCELPKRRGRFTVGSSNIVFHPNAPAAIRISTELRNLEKFPQGYPELVVTLTDKLGKVVGRRIFAASEYLADPTRRVQPESLTLVNLDVAKPVRSAIGFEVDVVSSR